MPAAEPSRPARRHWRGIAAVIVALYALAAIFAGLDRISASAPMVERVVPGPFRAHADVAAARIALAANDPRMAIRFAERAVEKAPMDSNASAALATGLLLTKDFPGADAAFRVSAAGGWRNIVTQLYWAEQSVFGGDWDLAAARIDAVLRANPTIDQADRIRALLEDDPRGRTALAAKLAARPVWLTPYVNVDAATPTAVLLQRAAIVREVAATSPPLGCDTIAPMARALRDRGRIDVAETTWRQHCPGGSGLGPGTDGSLGLWRDASNDPFGWTLSAQGDLVIEVPRSPSGSFMAENLSSASRLVATRPLRIPATARRVTWRAAEADGTVSSRISVSLTCGAPWLPQTRDGQYGAQALPALSCPVATVGLWLAPGRGAVSIDRLAVEPADRATSDS
ncbi:hypothetical protein [Croceicoccus sp. BE223]|uniref:tetratricopeptide repeat protein n=1 Tax=Croceicoccus sp. BE223 TaxID=2817716 RepID=UPI002860EB76|nr:hypothetical protein [Croceicoccus sp. BE223]MDR7102062.1 hypothetical protein [Croceicoccus sp. BE223]